MDLNTILAIVALVTSVGSAGVSYGVLSERMRHMRERQAEDRAQLQEQGKELARGQVRFASIEGKLDGIHDDIVEVKKMLQQQAEKRPN